MISSLSLLLLSILLPDIEVLTCAIHILYLAFSPLELRQSLGNFGKYLLSDERTDLILHHPQSIEDPNGIEERLKEVHHADVENFLESIKKVE